MSGATLASYIAAAYSLPVTAFTVRSGTTYIHASNHLITAHAAIRVARKLRGGSGSDALPPLNMEHGYKQEYHVRTPTDPSQELPHHVVESLANDVGATVLISSTAAQELIPDNANPGEAYRCTADNAGVGAAIQVPS